MKNREEILKELKEIAPELARLENKPASDVPASYFKAFPEDLMKKIRTNEIAAELSSIAPELGKLERVNAFDVPSSSYFQSLPEAVLQRIKVSEKARNTTSKGWMISLNVYFDRIAGIIFKPKYSVAFAGFATVVILAIMLVVKVEEQCADLDCRMAQISSEELNTYFNTHADEFNSALLDFDSDANSYGLNESNSLNHLSDEELNDAILD